jgi:hypothetical protein
MSFGKRHIRGLAPLAAAAVLLAAASLTEASLGASARQSQWYRARQASGSPAAAQVAGQFRTVGANLLWVKIESYHHEQEKRGKSWTQNGDLLPLLRATTYLDPHFVEAYSVHSYMLAANKHYDEALTLLHEGIRNNPKSSELYEGAGLIYARYLKQTEKGMWYYGQAYLRAEDDFDKNRLGRTFNILRRDIEAAKKKNTPVAG